MSATVTETATAYVYLVHHPESGAYKIGRSADPRTRLAQLAPKSACLELVATIMTTDSVWLERAMHLTFAHRRIRGEWFALSDDDVAVFTEVGAADGPEDLQNAVHRRYDTNEQNGFAWGCTGFPLADRIPIQVQEPSISLRLSDDLERRMTAWLAAQRVPPRRSAVVLKAIDEFLDRVGVPAIPPGYVEDDRE